MSAITELLVAVAASLYIVQELHRLAHNYRTMRVNKQLAELERLHEQAMEEIDVAFAMWWSDTSLHAVREYLAGNPPVPQEVRETMPESVYALLVDQALDYYRDHALHVAVHAFSDGRRDELVKKIPTWHGTRNKLEEGFKAHDDELRQIRYDLMQCGVDVEKLVEAFSS